jgi:adenylylsulfate kinase-like enzyme
MIILIFGQPASGKTTISDALYKRMDSDVTIRIDGDKWREVTANTDYSREGRIANLKGAFDMAIYLEKEGYIPILSFVAPYRLLRSYLEVKSNSLLKVFLEYSEDRGRDKYFVSDFDIPNDSCLKINTSILDVNSCVEKIVDHFTSAI